MSNSSNTSRVTKKLTTDEICEMSGENSNISWYRIKQVFIALNWGYVERVDVIPSGGTKRAFVHFAPGKFTQTRVLDALCAGAEIKIVYDDPWYWQISLSRSVKPAEAPERKQKPKIEIIPAVLGSGNQAKRHRGGRKLTLDLSEVKASSVGNCPIKSRQQEHERFLAGHGVAATSEKEVMR